MIKAEISSKSIAQRGQLISQTVTFPASRYDLLLAFSKARINGAADCSFTLEKTSNPNLHRTLKVIPQDRKTLDEVNFLAQRLADMFPEQRTLMEGAIKMSPPDSMKDLVNMSYNLDDKAVKEKGASALKHTADFLRIHSALSVLKNKLNGAVASLRRGVSQIEKVKTELHAARTHLGAAGRLMMKKDVKEAAAYDSKRDVLAGIQTIMNKTGGLLTGIGKATDSAIRKIEGLDHRGEKSSVRQTLREIQSVHAGGGPSRPERDTAR